MDVAAMDALYESCRNFITTSPPANSALLDDLVRAIQTNYKGCYEQVVDVIWIMGTLSRIRVGGANLYSYYAHVDLELEDERSNFGEELAPSDPVKAKRLNLARIVHELARMQLVGPSLICERLELELLELAGLIESSALLHKRLVRVNTSLLYKQQKYNLLREESEGFAKAITVLQVGTDAEMVFENLISLIGYFDLDPNRILDLILDAFAYRAYEDPHLYEVLLEKFSFPANTIASILGFRLAFMASGFPSFKVHPNDTESKHARMSASFVHCAARLIKAGFITPPLILPYLSSSDETLMDEIVKVNGRIRSATLTKSLSRKIEDTNDLALESQPGVHDVYIEISDQIGAIYNQKILLVASLLKVGCLDQALYFINHFRGITTIPLVAKAFADALHDVSDERFIDLVPFFNCSLYTNIPMLSRLCRIGTKAILLSPSDTDEETKLKWLGLIGDTIFASLSCVQSNPALSFQIWDFLKHFSFQVRFGLYGRWKNEIYSMNAESSFARSIALSDIRRVMRRLTKENVRQYGRLIAKLCHSNPVIVLPVILEQIQAYDNLIHPVVDALKYLTPLGFDVLSYTLIDCLANPSKDRLKEDGTNLSAWLQGLSLFTGSLFRKYLSYTDPIPLLQYTSKQLLDDSSFDLMVLSEVLHRVGGVATCANLSETHVESLAGSPTLQAEVQHNETVHTQLKPSKKASTRLIEALLSDNLLIPLWILLAQQRDVVTFKGDFSHVKLICTLLDTGHEVLLQYSSLVTNSIREGLVKDPSLLPPYAELTSTYKISADIAYGMRRIWERSFECLSNNAEESSFQEFFWRHELYDIYAPISLYNTECMRLKTLLSSPAPSSLADPTQMARWKKDRERAPQLILALESERDSQKKAVENTLKTLETSKEHFFAGKVNSSDIFKDLLLERAIYSPADAIYVGKLVTRMVEVKVPGFSFIALFESIIANLRAILGCFTELEAHNFARFIEIIFESIQEWFIDELQFNSQLAESLKREAFSMEACNADTDTNATQIENEPVGAKVATSENVSEAVKNVQNVMSHQEFKQLYFKWHLKLHRAFLSSLESGRYLSIKNSIILLTKISNSFPIMRKIGSSLQKAISKIKGETREDLKVMATRYSATLKHSEGRWIAEKDIQMGKDVKMAEIGEIFDVKVAESPPASEVLEKDEAEDHKLPAKKSEPRKREASESIESPASKRVASESTSRAGTPSYPGSGTPRESTTDSPKENAREVEKRLEKLKVSGNSREDIAYRKPSRGESSKVEIENQSRQFSGATDSLRLSRRNDSDTSTKIKVRMFDNERNRAETSSNVRERERDREIYRRDRRIDREERIEDRSRLRDDGGVDGDRDRDRVRDRDGRSRSSRLPRDIRPTIDRRRW